MKLVMIEDWVVSMHPRFLQNIGRDGKNSENLIGWEIEVAIGPIDHLVGHEYVILSQEQKPLKFIGEPDIELTLVLSSC